ncbi:MAG: lipid IV(A) 3-deoxy-D-manno-octulosonic acid transferase [Gammaproteobacteria bacterium]|nr:lipid IV(A) 3-deoxy-D-manno-octulosonic acid transferase [Gammaproteobacteria bacterium]
MWNLLYQSLLLLAWPWVHVRLYWRGRREPEYRQRIGERFGRVPAGLTPGGLWFHTVSAGETIAAAPLIRELAQAFADQVFLVTTMTPTGSAQVHARLGDRVQHCYAPYDFPWAVRRFYDQARPRLLVLMETELWPNLIAEAWRRGVPVVLVNGRLSERSARGYSRLGGLTRTMLGRLEYVACQYPEHVRRFAALGVPEDRLAVHGSVKFDAALPADHGERVAALRRRFALDDGPIWVAASTHPGEEALALAVHRRLQARFAGARLVLVPRHPWRAAEVMDLVRTFGWVPAAQSAPDPDTDTSAEVIIGDTMGELLYLYALGDAALVGGSFSGTGGHNPIEPALCGVPVIMGPSIFNFADVVARFREADCLELATDEQTVAQVLEGWLADPQARRNRGSRARRVIADNAGASARLRALLETQIRAVDAADGRGASAGTVSQ